MSIFSKTSKKKKIFVRKIKQNKLKHNTISVLLQLENCKWFLSKNIGQSINIYLKKTISQASKGVGDIVWHWEDGTDLAAEPAFKSDRNSYVTVTHFYLPPYPRPPNPSFLFPSSCPFFQPFMSGHIGSTMDLALDLQIQHLLIGLREFQDTEAEKLRDCPAVWQLRSQQKIEDFWVNWFPPRTQETKTTDSRHRHRA